MKNSLIILIKVALIILLVGVIALCVFWLPGLTDYIGSYFEGQESFGVIKIVIYIVSIILSLALISVFLLGFKFLPELKNDTIFHKKNANLIKLISIILFSLCGLFSLCVIGLFIIGDLILSPAFLFVDAIGAIVALMLFVLSRYVDNAAILKEEADATL